MAWERVGGVLVGVFHGCPPARLDAGARHRDFV
jgi:hypothetical protein